EPPPAPRPRARPAGLPPAQPAGPDGHQPGSPRLRPRLLGSGGSGGGPTGPGPRERVVSRSPLPGPLPRHGPRLVPGAAGRAAGGTGRSGADRPTHGLPGSQLLHPARGGPRPLGAVDRHPERGRSRSRHGHGVGGLPPGAPGGPDLGSPDLPGSPLGGRSRLLSGTGRGPVRGEPALPVGPPLPPD